MKKCVLIIYDFPKRKRECPTHALVSNSQLCTPSFSNNIGPKWKPYIKIISWFSVDAVGFVS